MFKHVSVSPPAFIPGKVYPRKRHYVGSSSTSGAVGGSGGSSIGGGGGSNLMVPHLVRHLKFLQSHVLKVSSNLLELGNWSRSAKANIAPGCEAIFAHK